jgi:hypothetical protein
VALPVQVRQGFSLMVPTRRALPDVVAAVSKVEPWVVPTSDPERVRVVSSVLPAAHTQAVRHVSHYLWSVVWAAHIGQVVPPASASLVSPAC